jgi:hypothetical protein
VTARPITTFFKSALQFFILIYVAAILYILYLINASEWMNEENQLECAIAAFQWQRVLVKNVSIIEKLHLKTKTLRLRLLQNEHFALLYCVMSLGFVDSFLTLILNQVINYQTFIHRMWH